MIVAGNNIATGQKVRANTERLLARYYFSKPEFIDGTAEFHQLCERYIPHGETVLEIGAGPGNATSQFLASRTRLVGVDISDDVFTNEWVEQAATYDGRRLPFRDASFKAVVTNYVLEHIANPRDHFKEVRRVLQPGGVYCFRTPNLWHYVTLASTVLPHSAHCSLVKWLQNTNEQGHLPYPTFYSANTRGSIRKLSGIAGLKTLVLQMVEKEPVYGGVSGKLFLLMMAYERIVNSSALFSGIRVNIFGVLQKPV